MFEGISRLLEKTPGSTTSNKLENIGDEKPRSESEIRLENINRTIDSNMVRINSLKRELDSIDVPYFADRQHPGVRGDIILQDGLISEIKRLEQANQKLEEERIALGSNEQIAN